jgi:hypothetical protein
VKRKRKRRRKKGEKERKGEGSVYLSLFSSSYSFTAALKSPVKTVPFTIKGRMSSILRFLLFCQ